MSQHLEALIDDHSDIMAEQMVKAVEWAGSEEDIRHAFNKLIDEFIEKAGLTVKGRHEYGLAGGRIDSKYGGVVIEYKYPKGTGKITENKNAPGVKAVVQQIKKRFQDFQAEEKVGMERIFGVGCDGDTFVFVRMRGAKIDVEDPQPVTPHTVQRLLRAIVSLGARGLSFTPENLTAHFGSESTSARDGVRLIHDLIHETDNPKAKTFFSQWQILFGEVCGALSAKDINILSAQVFSTRDGYAINRFQMTDLSRRPLPQGFRLERLRNDLNQVFLGKKSMEDLLARHGEHAVRRQDNRFRRPSELRIDNDISQEFTILEIRTTDRPGLLYDISKIIDEHKLNIHRAMLTTEAYGVIDVFYLTDLEYNKLHDGAKEEILASGPLSELFEMPVEVVRRARGVIVHSEFGRRLSENRSRGTDHGVAGPVFFLGGKVKPG
ncbi:MAG: DUF1501 domain-containing protein, partial [Bacteroidetes bacterium]|nr:DUF1501 domain-containing protein [Bacteroidota bacterium]